jgi:quercetin dioxygenase-like cupin family protein
MVEEAALKQTDEGLVPDGHGWFVMNARDARWIRRPGRGHNAPITGWTEFEAETYFPDLGVNLIRLEPGEPVGMYHWEADTEDFLVLDGDPLLIVEGEERPLRRWDFVHCPPETRHMIVGAGAGPALILAMGTRRHIAEDCNGGAYVRDETAASHGASIPEGVTEASEAYAHMEPPEPTRYEEGWLP